VKSSDVTSPVESTRYGQKAGRITKVDRFVAVEMAQRRLVLGCLRSEVGLESTPIGPNRAVPPGRVAAGAFPRHFVPGYHRKVPPGQRPGSL
jgi:hypothetical protein